MQNAASLLREIVSNFIISKFGDNHHWYGYDFNSNKIILSGNCPKKIWTDSYTGYILNGLGDDGKWYEICHKVKDNDYLDIEKYITRQYSVILIAEFRGTNKQDYAKYTLYKGIDFTSLVEKNIETWNSWLQA